MTHRCMAVALATTMLLLLVAAPAQAQDDDGSAPGDTIELETTSIDPEPFGVCLGGDCYVADEISRSDLEFTAGDDIDLHFTDDEDPPGVVVCLEGAGECSIKGDEISIEDIALTHDGRVVFGAVDADMSGTWDVTNRRATMRCKIPGLKATRLKVKRSQDAGSVERRPDGRLVGAGLGADETSFLLSRLGPGVYGSVFTFTEGPVSGTMRSFYGVLSEDEVAGTSRIETSFKVQGRKGKCTMDRNFDMKRTSGPQASETDDDATEEMEFSEEEAAAEEAAP